MVHRFTVVHDDVQGALERVAFAGRKIDSRSFAAPDGQGTLIATVFITKGGKFVLTLGEERGDTLSHYATYLRPYLIAEDEVLRELWDEEDLKEWAGSIYRRHFEETTTETGSNSRSDR